METEIVPNTFPSLFAAYTVIWAILAIYVFSLGKRLSRIESATKSDKPSH